MSIFSAEKKSKPDIAVERLVKTYEYKDAEGHKICDVNLVLGPKQEIPTGNPSYGRKVESYTLRYERQGQEKMEVDLVKFAQRRLKTPTPTYAVEEAGLAYHSESKHVVVLSESRFNDPLGPATLLHEYGHAEQEQDPKFADVIAASSVKKIAESGYENVSPDSIEKIRGMLNETQSKELGEDVQRLRENDQRRYLAEVKIEFSGRDLDLLRASDLLDTGKIQKIQKLEEEIVENQKILLSTKEEQKRIFEALEPMLYLPVQVLERNATARALLSLRELRDVNGLDLLVPVKRDVTEASLSEKDWYKEKKGINCDAVVEGTFKRLWSSLLGKKDVSKDVTATAEERLTKYALSTYEATTPELMKQFGYIATPLRVAQDAFIDARLADEQALKRPSSSQIQPRI